MYHAHLVQQRDTKLSWLWNRMTYSASAVLCVSKRVMDSMSEGNKLLVYNPNLNYRGYKGEKKNAKWTVAFVGSLIEIKGVIYLIEAAKRLPDVAFLIYGKGPLEADLKRSAPTNVIFKGFCNDVIIQLYDCVDIVVVPTIIEEALPLAAVDAKSVGLPVIVTNIGGQSEIVREGIDGIKVPVKNPTAIAQAIRDITSSCDRYNEMAYKSYESSNMFDLTEFERILTTTFENDWLWRR
ncbi:glycosyltransferase family 4 protein [Bacteroides helcogenes]|uniref:glycosyltransferase family 4 protein n=1 Tax=Bacteroides helcogenes TaxID=290053 RepID=UPI002A90B42A|nr:glycosyltransferase family 4 protein [Bacteroides helcogenes]MDY5237590.1 glycosyltransferase family 4 protein [Bacteroides helcogenes]